MERGRVVRGAVAGESQVLPDGALSRVVRGDLLLPLLQGQTQQVHLLGGLVHSGLRLKEGAPMSKWSSRSTNNKCIY